MSDETTPDEGSATESPHPKGQPPKGEARTAWQDQGSLVQRLKAAGNGRSRAQNQAEADAIAHTEAQVVHDREAAEREGKATYGAATHDSHNDPQHEDHEPLRPAIEPVHHVPTPEEVVRKEKITEWVASAMFLLSIVCVLGFCASYLWINIHDHPTALNIALGSTLAGALLLVGAAAIVWAKGIMPHEPAVQERHPDNSTDEEKAALSADWLVGVEESGATRRKMLLGTMGLSMGALAVPALFLFRDLGPSPFTGPERVNLLGVTAWKAGQHLIDIVGKQPVNQADVGVGSLITVLPEGHPDSSADSSVMVIRLNPEDINMAAFGPDEVVDGIIAYSKICTHAGCPVSLYEEQRHHFLCPCHQSTFDAADSGKVLFGPAARALPVLPIYVDDEGFLRAKSAFHEPVGPSFWERG